jgi:Ca-activated chloride channel family protein
MRLTQNIVLIILICFLLLGIFSLEETKLLSFPTVKKDHSVSTLDQSTDNLANPTIQIVWNTNPQDQTRQISTSKKLLKKLLADFPDKIKLGIITYGTKDSNNQPNYYSVAPASNNQQKILEIVTSVTPSGESSINESLLKAKQKLEFGDEPKHILLVTDGQDSGKILPERTVKKLQQAKIKTHVIHVGEISEIQQIKLKTLAELGSGKYFTQFEEQKIVPTMNLP